MWLFVQGNAHGRTDIVIGRGNSSLAWNHQQGLVNTTRSSIVPQVTCFHPCGDHVEIAGGLLPLRYSPSASPNRPRRSTLPLRLHRCRRFRRHALEVKQTFLRTGIRIDFRSVVVSPTNVQASRHWQDSRCAIGTSCRRPEIGDHIFARRRASELKGSMKKSPFGGISARRCKCSVTTTTQ